MSIITEKKHLFDEAIVHLKDELANVRTGRANPELVEQIKADYYGTPTPLIQLGSISTPDSHSILIQPWDQNALKDIEKAIRASELGFNPVNEGHQIRIPIPALTEERRKELVKLMQEKLEATRVRIRGVREDMWRDIKEQKNSGSITEDDLYLLQKELQKETDNYNAMVKDIGEQKESEIMTI
ncbi:MAG: ribosome recycling factor [Patescibacteria group bacterium]